MVLTTRGRSGWLVASVFLVANGDRVRPWAQSPRCAENDDNYYDSASTDDHDDGAADHDDDAGASAGHRSCAGQSADYNDHQRIRRW